MASTPAAGYYSVRMRANHQGRHISGAEDLVAPEQAAATTRRFVERALAADPAAEVVVHVDPVTRTPVTLRLLPLFTADVSPDKAMTTACALLASAGIDAEIASQVIATLRTGAAGNGENMRGAMLVNSRSGARLERDPRRGVRARHFAVCPELRATLAEILTETGYPHHRTLEGWLLATKMVGTPGALAELCCSDDPTYTTGYVALAGCGYVRIPNLKAAGDPHGGRALFLAPDSDSVLATTWLQEVPCLAGGPVQVHPPQRLAAIVEALHP